MKLKLIDYPIKIDVQEYLALADKLATKLMSYEEVLSIYQMGSVKDPGISDLDLICVFRNGSKNDLNLRKDLEPKERNILTHGIFGIEEKNFSKSLSNNLISNLNLLAGKNLGHSFSKNANEIILKRQIAFEYILKLYITLDVQVTLKIIKVRAFLLLAKAIMFDLELLEINDGKLFDLVKKVIRMRSQWFKTPPSDKEIIGVILNFHKELEIFLQKNLNSKDFHLPKESLKIASNLILIQSKIFTRKHKGIILPPQFGFLGRKYINVQARFNHFCYSLPFSLPKEDSELNKREVFYKKLVQTNRYNYPSFIPLTTSLSVY